MGLLLRDGRWGKTGEKGRRGRKRRERGPPTSKARGEERGWESWPPPKPRNQTSPMPPAHPSLCVCAYICVCLCVTGQSAWPGTRHGAAVRVPGARHHVGHADWHQAESTGQVQVCTNTSTCLPVCLPVCLRVCLLASLPVCLSVCLIYTCMCVMVAACLMSTSACSVQSLTAN